jgi:MYXO-CTERM domain-containing protein
MFQLLTVAALLSHPLLANPIVGGETTDEYPEVVMLWIGQGTCSGTLIDAGWVLTAGHCVDGVVNLGNAVVYRGPEPTGGANDGSSRVEAVYTHPDYRDDMSMGRDAGLVKLSTPFEDVTPAKLTRTPVDEDWTGRPVRYVGYGVTHEDAWDSGTKRTVEVPVYQYDNHWLYTYDQGHNMCWGDSGGAAFLQDEDGGLVLGGIISWVGSWDDWDYPCTTGWGSNTRIDTIHEWIDEHVDARYIEDPPIDTAPPEDTAPGDTAGLDEEPGGCGCAAGSTAGAWGLGLLLLPWLRRRRTGPS